jgi:hypothetical protein
MQKLEFYLDNQLYKTCHSRIIPNIDDAIRLPGEITLYRVIGRTIVFENEVGVDRIIILIQEIK